MTRIVSALILLALAAGCTTVVHPGRHPHKKHHKAVIIKPHPVPHHHHRH